MSGKDGNGELEQLRARVTELEHERVEQAVRANAAIARAQEQTYWLDRWGLDLNAVMRRRGAEEFRTGLRAVREVYRRYKRLRRRFDRA